MSTEILSSGFKSAGAFSKRDSNGNVSLAKILQYSRVTTYDSGYICLVPIGGQPPAPPPEIIEAGRYEAEQNFFERRIASAS